MLSFLKLYYIEFILNMKYFLTFSPSSGKDIKQRTVLRILRLSEHFYRLHSSFTALQFGFRLIDVAIWQLWSKLHRWLPQLTSTVNNAVTVAWKKTEFPSRPHTHYKSFLKKAVSELFVNRKWHYVTIKQCPEVTYTGTMLKYHSWESSTAVIEM